MSKTQALAKTGLSIRGTGKVLKIGSRAMGKVFPTDNKHRRQRRCEHNVQTSGNNTHNRSRSDLDIRTKEINYKEKKKEIQRDGYSHSPHRHEGKLRRKRQRTMERNHQPNNNGRYERSASRRRRFQLENQQKKSYFDPSHSREKEALALSPSSNEARDKKDVKRHKHGDGRKRRDKHYREETDLEHGKPSHHHGRRGSRNRSCSVEKKSHGHRSDSSCRRRRQNRTPLKNAVISDETDDDDNNKHHHRRRQSERKHRRRGRRVKKNSRSGTSSGRFDKYPDDSVGHYRGRAGAIVNDRYKVLRDIGLGTFGRVVECLDLDRCRSKNNSEVVVAIKIVRDVPRYRDSARLEAKILRDDVNYRGGRGVSHFVVLFDTFIYRGHFCLVLERLGPSLYDFLKHHNHRPFPMVCVQDFAIQLLEALEFMHGFGLIHTDLKLENILLMNEREAYFRGQSVPERTKIKIVDFGGACHNRDKKSSVISTRQYRSPECILGTGWDMASDVWSLGCILAELYQGELLFATHENVEHLALIETMIGLFPEGFINAAKHGPQHDLATKVFNARCRHRMDRVLSRDSEMYVQQSLRLDQLIHKEHGWFLSLLRIMLVIDPHTRGTAHECLKFLTSIRRNVVQNGA